MISSCNHREGPAGITDKNTFRTGVSIAISDEERTDPHFLAQSRYWASPQDTAQRIPKGYPYQWLMGFKDVTSATNTRTMIACVLPKTAVLCSIRVVFLEDYQDATPGTLLSLLANWNSFCFDFFCRQSTPGNHLSDYIIRQLPTLPPSTYQQPCPWDATLTVEDWILPRVLELTYTAWDLEGFAQDVLNETANRGIASRGVKDGRVVSGSTGLAEGDGTSRDMLSVNTSVSQRGNVRDDISDSESSNLDSSQHSRGMGERESGRIHSVPQDRSGFSQGTRDTSSSCRESRTNVKGSGDSGSPAMRGTGQDAQSFSSLNASQESKKVNDEALLLPTPYSSTPPPYPTPDSPLPIPPFHWNPDRRSWLQAELDAAFFHLYSIQREDVDFMLESFPIVKRKDRQKFGSFQTKDRILQIYDQLEVAMQSGVAYHSDLDPPTGSLVPSTLGKELG
jgi:hypothetical protein